MPPEAPPEIQDEEGSAEHSQEEPEPQPEPTFEEGLKEVAPIDTGRIVNARTTNYTPSKPLPELEPFYVGKKPPPKPKEIEIDPDDIEIDDPDDEPDEPPQPAGPPIDEQILEEARAKAAQIISDAQMQAKQMVERTAAETQQAAQDAFQQAQEQGFQQGLQAGQQQGYEQSVTEFVERINQAKDMFVQLVRARRKVIADIEPQVARLSVKIAERVVGQELETNPEVVVGIVRQALSVMNDREEVNIRVHPEDAPFVEENRASLERLVEGLKKFEISAEAAMERGSVVVETNLGNIDARVSTQLDAIRAGIEETAKMRAEELAAEAESAPVEVPGDPEFEQRQQAEAPPQPGEGHEAPPEEMPMAEHPEMPEMAEMHETQMEMDPDEAMHQTMMEEEEGHPDA